MSMSYDGNKYYIKVVTGSRSSVDALVENELKEYPKKDYGTIILHLEETDDAKTVRIIRYKTKDLCERSEGFFEKGEYPFTLGSGL